jgi:hypothetical protein
VVDVWAEAFGRRRAVIWQVSWRHGDGPLRVARFADEVDARRHAGLLIATSGIQVVLRRLVVGPVAARESWR